MGQETGEVSYRKKAASHSHQEWRLNTISFAVQVSKPCTIRYKNKWKCMSQHCQLKRLLKRREYSSLINYASSAGDPCISHRSTINKVKKSSVSSVTKTKTKQFHLHWVYISLHNTEHCVLQRLLGTKIDRVLTRPVQEAFSTYLFQTFLSEISLSFPLSLSHMLSYPFSSSLYLFLSDSLSFSPTRLHPHSSLTHRLDCYKCCL